MRSLVALLEVGCRAWKLLIHDIINHTMWRNHISFYAEMRSFWNSNIPGFSGPVGAGIILVCRRSTLSSSAVTLTVQFQNKAVALTRGFFNLWTIGR